MEAVSLDALAGFGGIAVQVELYVKGEGAPAEEAIYASKRVVFAPRLPPERVGNLNPTIGEIYADGLPAGRCIGAAGPQVVAPGQEIELEPIEPEGVREDYVLPTFDGTVQELTENLRYSWFATAGEFEKEQTGGAIDPFGNVPTLENKWTAPALEDVPAEGLVRMWVVQRDERGGAFWTKRCFLVQE
jgi:hypothetical protein